MIAHELGHELIYAANERRKRKIEEGHHFHEFIATVSEPEYLKKYSAAKTLRKYTRGEKLAIKFFHYFPKPEERNAIIRELLLNENVTNMTGWRHFSNKKE